MTNEEYAAGKIRDAKIRKMRAEKATLSKIANQFDISQARVSQICGPTGSVKDTVPMRSVTIYLSYETVDALKALAKKEKSNVSVIVKKAISDYLKKKIK